MNLCRCTAGYVQLAEVTAKKQPEETNIKVYFFPAPAYNETQRQTLQF